MKKLINYFLQGLLLIAPIVLTIWIIIQSIIWFDEIIPFNIPVEIPGYDPFNLPGVGIVAIFLTLTFLGFLASRVIPFSFMAIVHNFFERFPLTKIVYTSLKEFIEAFVGEKKRFNKPVTVVVSKDPLIERIGFITKTDLTNLGMENNKVAVYIPFSYSISGIMLIVTTDNVRAIQGSGTNAMKFTMSGGVTEVN